MRWLVDGYNVIRRDAELRDAEMGSLEAGRTALLALLGRLAREVSDQFVVVFDGARRMAGPNAAGGQVQVVFSRPPESADDVLRRLAATHREGAVVVTSDRAVLDSARRAGAVGVGADAFLDAARRRTGEAPHEDEDDDTEEQPRPGQKLSREARATARALRRLARR